MQHLFNRIYVAPISRLEQGQDDGAVIFITSNERIINGLHLQDSTGSEDMVAQLNRVRFNVEVGELVFNYPTYAQLISAEFNGNEDSFFRFLLDWPSTRRLVIYTELQQIESFMLRWIKTFLPNVTESSAHTILRLISLRERMLAQNAKLSLAVPIGNTADAIIAGARDSLTFAYTLGIWQNVAPFNFGDRPRLTLSDLGMEFLLATHLCNLLTGTADTDVDQITSDKVVRFVKKRLVYSLQDDKDGITQSLHHAFDLFGVQLDITDPAAIAAFVATHPQHAWLFDNEFTPENYVAVWANYNIAEVFIEGNKLVQLIGKETGVYNTERFEVLKMVFKNDVTLADVIAVEMAPHFSCLILAAEVTDKSLNRYVLDYIFQLYRSGDFATLRELSVV